MDSSVTSNSSQDEVTDTDASLPVGIQIIVSSLFLVSIPVAVMGNGIMCSLVFRKSAMKSSINLLMAHHSLANILLSVCCAPFVFVSITTNYWVFGAFMCDVIAFLHLAFSGAVSLLLSVISIDRYFILVRRIDILKSERIYKILALLWAVCGISSLPPLFGLGNYSAFSNWPQCVLSHVTSQAGEIYSLFLLTLMYYVPGVFMTYCYVVVIWRVRHNNLKIHHIPVKSETRMRRISPSSKNPPVQIDISFKTKAFRALFIIYLCWLLSWFPFAVCLLVWNARRNLEEHVLAGTILLALGYFNCCTAPFVYYYKVLAYHEYCQHIWNNIADNMYSLSLTIYGRRRVNPASLYEVS